MKRFGELFAAVSLTVSIVWAATLFSPTNMTSQVLPTPYVATASSAFANNPCPALPTPCGLNASFAPYGAFRGTSGAWTGMNNGVDFLKLDIGTANAPQVLTSYSTLCGPGGTDVARTAKDWVMRGSLDDITYVALDTRTGIAPCTNNVTTTYMVNGGVVTGFRYFKMDITASNDATFTEVMDLRLFGNPPGGVKHRVISQ